MGEYLRGEITVDAHHHLWRYSADEYGWIDESMAMLRHDFTVSELRTETASAAIDCTIAVQARQTVEETRDLLEMARQNKLIGGVVGWLPIAEEATIEALLDELGQNPALVGLRHVVQAEPDGFLDREEFNRGMGSVGGHDLAYDLLILPHQLEETIRFVDRHPGQRFVLDHLAKPSIASGEMEPWRSGLGRLGERPNVWCKISGMATEAEWHSWDLSTLRPYLDTAVEVFGPRRLLAGSDWPVCLLACGYQRWWQVLRSYFSAFSLEEQGRVFGGNAIEAYRLFAESGTKDVVAAATDGTSSGDCL